ncbi:hypothetical protein DFQ28_009241 [Apophysomyces sp. BC1034]|nr:hypothetical protein DFQ30_008976 [Apophysomyces sp. BC1015]KAG0175346.1 hypothetical protein DFQ29_007166 [Apophysomyces sp. BC1021]KAG0192417.1 hypothetical protein DFQ28_009241 [Apophysomyces sp. BC1034]
MITIADEQSFITQYLDSLSTRSVRFGEDYIPRTLPSPLRVKRRPVAVTKNKSTESPVVAKETTTTPAGTLELTIKVLKPASQFKLSNALATDTVATLKQRIYQLQTSLPANRQRLLLKGKALADQKTLSDYGISNGSVIHLMAAAAKPSTTAATTTAAATTVEPTTGRFGMSLSAEKELESPAFWTAVEKTVSEKMNKEDASIVVNKFKQALFA